MQIKNWFSPFLEQAVKEKRKSRGNTNFANPSGVERNVESVPA